MAWAFFGLKYLRVARSSTHEELNEVMNEVREMTRVARSQSWYAACKSITQALYHYSDEFPGDGKIPGDTFQSGFLQHQRTPSPSRQRADLVAVGRTAPRLSMTSVSPTKGRRVRDPWAGARF